MANTAQMSILYVLLSYFSAVLLLECLVNESASFCNMEKRYIIKKIPGKDNAILTKCI